MPRRVPEPASGGDALETLARRRRELGDDLPRLILFVFGEAAPDALRTWLRRLPPELDDWIGQVVVMLGAPSEAPPRVAEQDLAGRALALRFHRPPRPGGPGTDHKAAFEYARREGVDFVVCMSLAEGHAPERLPSLLVAALCEGEELVVASESPRLGDSRRAGVPFGRWVGARLLTGLQNRALGMRVPDYHASFRVYSARILDAVPFQLNSDGPLFDVEILIQCRALGISPRAVPVVPTTPAEVPASLRWQACGTAVGYRLHQLHVIRRGRYFVDLGVHYTLKHSETSSHMQIVEAIRPGTRVLDLGCSQGLLARPLREKQVRVTGVDSGPPERLAKELEDYHQRDLELPLELPCGRDFDYVLCADVIEHLRNRRELLRSARRFLRPEGRLLISTPNIALWFYRLSLLVGRFEYGPRGVLDQGHVHLYTRDSFRREVERAGFQKVRERVTSLPFEVVFRSTGRSRLVRAVARAYHLLARVWPEMFAYQFVLEAAITTLDEEATDPWHPQASPGSAPEGRLPYHASPGPPDRGPGRPAS